MKSEQLNEILQERHALLAWLLARTAESRSLLERPRFIERSTAAIGGHLRSATEVTNPALRLCLGGMIPPNLEQAYATVGLCLADILTVDPQAAEFDTRIPALLMSVVGMCAMEREVVLPGLYRALGPDDLEALAARSHEEFEVFAGSFVAPARSVAENHPSDQVDK